jgi:hypothetical protein
MTPDLGRTLAIFRASRKANSGLWSVACNFRPQMCLRGRSGHFHWHSGALLPPVAVERITIGRLMLAPVVAVVVVVFETFYNTMAATISYVWCLFVSQQSLI